MGATNHTANYDLPQWIGTDKPTFLGDMNDAFLKIDTQMKANADSATSAVSTAGSAESKASAASQSANQALQAAQTASTNATQALSTANNAASTANSAHQIATAASSITTPLSTLGGWSGWQNCTLAAGFSTPSSTVISETGFDFQLKVNYNATIGLIIFNGTVEISSAPTKNDFTTIGYMPASVIPVATNKRYITNLCNMTKSSSNSTEDYSSRHGVIDTDRSIKVNLFTVEQGATLIFQNIFYCYNWFN